LHYLFLTLAIFLDVTGTLLLPVSQNFTRLIPAVALGVGHGAAFYFLTLALNTLPIAVVDAT
jgi:small multidrug resistance pump